MVELQRHIWICLLITVVGLVLGQECPEGCTDLLAAESTLSCPVLEAESGCESAWMQKFCQCTCGQCQQTPSPEVVEETPCECSDAVPAGSTYTCEQFKANEQCSVLLSYGFCECTCEKCYGAQNVVYILPELSTVNEEEEVEETVDEAATVSTVATGGMETVSEPVGTTDQRVIAASVVPLSDVEEDVGLEEAQGVPVVQAEEDENVSCPSECNEVSPDRQYTCAEQKRLGKCERGWMQGFCECTCGTCPSLTPEQQQLFESAATESLTSLSTPNISEASFSSSVASSLSASSRLSQQPSTDIDFEICSQSCNENPPPRSTLSCSKQASLGKCSRDWMTGFCECTCGTCDILQEGGQSAEQKSVAISQDVVQVEVVGPHNFPTVPAAIPAQPVQTPLSSFNNNGGNVKINILHFNDLHARLQPTTQWWWECEPWRNDQGECFGGIARIKTIVDQTRAEGTPMLLLDGGDDFVGTSWDYHDPTNKATAHFLNRLGVDAMVLGNHEFDHGVDNLIAHVQQANYPVISCNMDASKKPTLQYLTQKYVIKEVGGLKVGILGLTTTYTNWAEAANPHPVWFTDAYAAAEVCVRELKSQGAQVVIALSHNGYNFDKHLAKKLRDVDVVVGAHSHTFLAKTGDRKGPVLDQSSNQDWSQGDYPTMVWSEVQQGRKIPVVQAGWASRYIGKLTVEFNSQGDVVSAQGYPILLGGHKSSNNVQENQEFARDLENMKWW
eukprot:TRINITY_DN27322_c0_g1_i4.p1 TRINITY_DN27322_c0_g1~~TRINITY_DN27322_c0_g1_i4.p1  ORF type:complete len:801 (-),score=68.51 TRINITY_DN27322_c0_g1_i4:1417-3606(-)